MRLSARFSFILLLGICGAGIIIYSTKHIPSSQQPFLRTNEESLLENAPLMTGFELTEYNKGGKLFTIKSDKFCVRNKKVRPFNFRVALGKSVEMEGVEVIYYKDGKPFSYLDSKFATMDIRRKNIEFQGEPSLVTKERRTLSAKEMRWDNSSKRILAKGGCIVGREGELKKAELVNTDIELKDIYFKEKT